MGNSISEEEREIRREYLNKMQNINLPILDIGMKNGSTGYLDFIKPDDVGTNDIMKGWDSGSRPFFVFRAEYEYPNGLKKKTFTTFFQRYSNINSIWMGCGNYGKKFMETSGGMTEEQIEYVIKNVQKHAIPL